MHNLKVHRNYSSYNSRFVAQRWTSFEMVTCNLCLQCFHRRSRNYLVVSNNPEWICDRCLSFAEAFSANKGDVDTLKWVCDLRDDSSTSLDNISMSSSDFDREEVNSLSSIQLEDQFITSRRQKNLAPRGSEQSNFASTIAMRSYQGRFSGLTKRSTESEIVRCLEYGFNDFSSQFGLQKESTAVYIKDVPIAAGETDFDLLHCSMPRRRRINHRFIRSISDGEQNQQQDDYNPCATVHPTRSSEADNELPHHYDATLKLVFHLVEDRERLVDWLYVALDNSSSTHGCHISDACSSDTNPQSVLSNYQEEEWWYPTRPITMGQQFNIFCWWCTFSTVAQDYRISIDMFG